MTIFGCACNRVSKLPELIKRVLVFVCFSMALFAGTPAAFAADERPANFIFLVDVSGSMLYKSEMVTASDGTKVFLFEALRQALKQIVSDPRVVSPDSKACVITFGTQIEEKSDWPQKLDSEEKRQAIVKSIESADSLQADKHGDTYMGGALSAAIDKANSFYASSDPCTTTYVVMLTDGWDEPPHGASIKVTDAAKKFVARANEIQNKLGVKTWRALVIGLQNLPDQKAGTTTAKQLASMLDGQFVDVTKQAGGTVAEKIFVSLKQIIEGLKGELKVSNQDGAGLMKGGVLRFGTVDGNGVSMGSVAVESKSCYLEQISGVRDISSTIKGAAAEKLKSSMGENEPYKLVSELPPNAITLKMEKGNYTLQPKFNERGVRQSNSETVELTVQAHNNCPAGHFVGALTFDATAKVPTQIPFSVSVPGRLVSDHEKVSLLIKKRGLLWTEPASGVLEDSIKDVSGGHSHAVYEITVTPESARLASGEHAGGKASSTIDLKQINGGKPDTLHYDTSTNGQKILRLPVDIPADQVPGAYTGKLDLAVTGDAEVVAPSAIDYEIVVEPSPWEKVAPIAVPTFILLMFTLVLWVFFWLRTLKR